MQLFRTKLSKKLWFRLTLRHRLVQLVWCHTFWFHFMGFSCYWCGLRLTKIFLPDIRLLRPKFLVENLVFGFGHWLKPCVLCILMSFNDGCIQQTVTPIHFLSFWWVHSFIACSSDFRPKHDFPLIFVLKLSHNAYFPITFLQNDQNNCRKIPGVAKGKIF